MQGDGVGAKGILTRFIAAIVLVYGTFNPEGYSFYHWAVASAVNGTPAAGEQLPVKVLVGLILVAAWVFFVQTTRRSIGWKGALLILAILGAFVWALVDWEVLQPGNSRVIAHIVLVASALVLALGMSWSHISRKVSGQVDTDDIN
ncbi:MAG: DUF6524 family protein [Gemmatimonadales bacterium]